MKKALLVIDLQNDYFPGGAYPLWNAAATLGNIEAAMARASEAGVPVILIQHVADPLQGLAPFFNAETVGARIHSRIRTASPDAPVVVKAFADSFVETSLEQTLTDLRARARITSGFEGSCIPPSRVARLLKPVRLRRPRALLGGRISALRPANLFLREPLA